MSGVLTAFARLVYLNRHRLQRVWLVSPWLAAERTEVDPISVMVEALRGTNCIINVVTRTPKTAWHSDALRIFSANFKPVLYYCDTLHTKLYILECDGFRCAVLGSPNLTGRADRINRELAVEFRTTVESREDDVAALITALTEYARDLISEDDVLLAENP